MFYCFINKYKNHNGIIVTVKLGKCKQLYWSYQTMTYIKKNFKK